MDALAATCRSGLNCTVYSIGNSYEGRPIKVFKVKVFYNVISLIREDKINACVGCQFRPFIEINKMSISIFQRFNCTTSWKIPLAFHTFNAAYFCLIPNVTPSQTKRYSVLDRTLLHLKPIVTPSQADRYFV